MADQNTIFISYARKDSSFVMRLTKDLQDAGVEVWLDKTSIDPGQEWDAAIEEAMETSGSLLIVLSRNSVGSRNVMDEVSYALEEDKRVLPVLYQPCKVPFRLRRVQRSDFTAGYQEGLADLLDVLDKPFEPPPPVAPWRIFLRRVPDKVWVGLVALLILVGAIALLWNFRNQIGSLKGERDGLADKRDSLTAEVISLERKRDSLSVVVHTLKTEKRSLTYRFSEEVDSLNNAIEAWKTAFDIPDPNESFEVKWARLQTLRTTLFKNSINPRYPDDATKRQANQLILELLVELDIDIGIIPRGDPQGTMAALKQYNQVHNFSPDSLFLITTEDKMLEEYRLKQRRGSSDASG